MQVYLKDKAVMVTGGVPFHIEYSAAGGMW